MGEVYFDERDCSCKPIDMYKSPLQMHIQHSIIRTEQSLLCCCCRCCSLPAAVLLCASKVFETACFGCGFMETIDAIHYRYPQLKPNSPLPKSSISSSATLLAGLAGQNFHLILVSRAVEWRPFALQSKQPRGNSYSGVTRPSRSFSRVLSPPMNLH